MIDPHKPKYFDLYWQMAEAAASQTVCTRHQVGAVVVTPTGMISPGWNGMPAGLPNECESTMVDGENPATGHQFMRPKTNPEVIHAERNAIDKMTRQGIPTADSLLFVTRAPCFECAKAIHGLGLKAVLYDEPHDDLRGIELLQRVGVTVYTRMGNEVRQLNRYYKRGPV